MASPSLRPAQRNLSHLVDSPLALPRKGTKSPSHLQPLTELNKGRRMKFFGHAILMSFLLAVPMFATTSSGIPSNARVSRSVDGGNWAWEHDRGTPGTSSGSSYYAVSNPSTDGKSREVNVSYYNHGGERYHTSVANDSSATHFVYDARIYVVNPSQIANIELDINQVTSNGRTVIFGSQCSAYSGTWEFVTVSGKSPHWHSSNIGCNPKSWSANAWHHIQVASHRDTYGNVYYDWVSLDGRTSYFSNAKGYDSMGLGWAPGSVTLNFQLDGASSSHGSMKLFMDQLNIYRW